MPKRNSHTRSLRSIIRSCGSERRALSLDQFEEMAERRDGAVLAAPPQRLDVLPHRFTASPVCEVTDRGLSHGPYGSMHVTFMYGMLGRTAGRIGMPIKDTELLQEFIRIGQDIMRWDRREAYGADWDRVAEAPPDLAFPPPGYLGPDYRGVVFLDSNPSSAPERRAEHGRWDALFEKWCDEGTVEAYDAVFEAYLRYFPTLQYWQREVEPILRAANLEPRQICYLNLSKSVPRDNNTTKRILRIDWLWTRKQLDLLRPAIVVLGGKGVGNLFKEFWPDSPLRAVVQDRSKSQQGSAKRSQARRIAREIKAALAPPQRPAPTPARRGAAGRGSRAAAGGGPAPRGGGSTAG